MAINLIENKKLTEEWNYEKNKPLTPEKFTVASNKKVWWKCANGHEWEAVISNRTVLNRGCPYCCGQKRKKDIMIYLLLIQIGVNVGIMNVII